MADNGTPIAIDSSSFQPLQTTATPPVAPAAAPQAAPISIDSSSFQPLQAQSSFLDKAKNVVAGPETALGAPLSEGQQKEVSGVGDILNGNLRQGLGKIYDQEIGNMHIIQGSPIEKIIQKFNPGFKGGITPDSAEAENHANQAGIDNPLADPAQLINKEQHPILKAVTEAAQSLTSPKNVAIMASTGGMGLVESPRALGVANKLLSAGFSAQAIGQAYKNFKDFKEAYDNGNSNEALYKLTHSVLSGAMAYAAGAHAAGAPMEVAGATDKAVAGKVTDLLNQAGESVKGAAAGAGEKIIGTAKRALDLDNTLTDLVKKASPPTKGKSMEYGDTLKAAEPQLREVFRRNPDVSTPKEMYDALDQHIKGQEGLLQAKAEQYKGTAKAAMPNLDSEVRAALNDAFKDSAGQYTPQEQRSATNAVLNHLHQESGLDAKGNMTYRPPDLFEAEGVRQRFNEDANPVFGSNAPAVPKAEAFAKAEAAKVLRDNIDAKYDELGVGNVKEWRKQEAALIDVRDQIANADKKANEMGEFNLWNSLTKQLGWKVPLAAMLGTSGAGLEGGAALAGGTALMSTLHDYLRDLKTNPNRLIQRASEMANKEGPSGAAIPSSSGVNPTLKIPYEKLKDEALDIPARYSGNQTASGIREHEWGHALVAHKEGFGVDGIKSHLHPEIRPLAGGRVSAATALDLSSLGLGANGLIPKENFNAGIDRILSTVMAGAAANEVHSGIPLAENPGLHGDLSYAKRILTKMGYSPEEVQAKIDAAFERAKNHLTDQHAMDILKENKDVREPGLSNTLHVSGNRMSEVLNELDRRQNAGNDRGLEENNREHDKRDVAGREGGPSEELGSKAAVAAESGRGNVKVPPERSTGQDNLDAVIKQSGAIPGGFQKGDAEINVPDLALFHDPKTGSTLAYPADKLTPEIVATELAKSRKAYGLSVELPSEEDRIGTRVPTAKGATESPIEGRPITVGLEAVNNSRGLPEKLAAKVRDIPGVKMASNVKDPAKVMDRFIKHVSDNLKYLYDQSTPKEQTDNAKWYESASKLAKDEADLHGIDHRQAAAAIAAMSPQKDWDMNVSLARRVMDTFHNHAGEIATPEMIQKGRDIVTNTTKNGVVANEKLNGLLDKIAGKKLGDLTDPMEKAAWVRLYDETNNPREYHKIDPATGDKLDLVRNANGNPGKVAWGSLNQVGNAISVLEDGSRKNISDSLGGNHKVRNFYNNIIDPTNNEDVTIDTHAVAAGLLRPLSGNDLEVKHNFGGISNAKTGSHGTYPLYAEAYRRAAADLGIKPRELQSVTWEKVRNLFPAEWKTLANKLAVDKIWNLYDNGKVSLNQARQQIVDLAGKPSERPAPAGKPKGITGRLLGKVPNGLKALVGE